MPTLPPLWFHSSCLVSYWNPRSGVLSAANTRSPQHSKMHQHPFALWAPQDGLKVARLWMCSPWLRCEDDFRGDLLLLPVWMTTMSSNACKYRIRYVMVELQLLRGRSQFIHFLSKLERNQCCVWKLASFLIEFVTCAMVGVATVPYYWVYSKSYLRTTLIVGLMHANEGWKHNLLVVCIEIRKWCSTSNQQRKAASELRSLSQLQVDYGSLLVD